MPQAALIADQQGVYVFVVEDGKAAIRRIKTGGESGTDVVVDEGLSGGEQVIVEGLQTRAARAWRCRQRPCEPTLSEADRCCPPIFVDRPRLAIVIAIVTTIAGLLVALCHPARAISRYRSAAGLGHHVYPGANPPAWSTRPSRSRSRRRSSASTR